MFHVKHFKVMKKQILFLIIAILLTASAISGCANIDIDTDGVSDGMSDGGPAASGDVSDVSLPDYNGFSDVITIATTDTSPFVAYEDTVGTLSAAIDERDQKLAQKYSVEIRTSYYTEEQVLAGSATSGLSGLKFANLYCFSADVTMQLGISGRLCDLSSLPDFDKICDTVGRENVLYGTDGSASALVHSSTLYQQSAYCVFYNRQLIKSSGLADPAVLYVENKWTYDEFLRYSHTVASEIMNKGSIDYENDVFGFSFADTSETLTAVLWHSQGQDLLSDIGEEPTLYQDLTAQNKVADRLCDVFNDRSRYDKDGSKAAELFKSGRCGMLIYKLDYCKSLDDSDIEYGVIPLPDGRGYVDGDALVYSFSSDAEPEYSSAVILSLLISSGDSFKNALCDSYTLLYSRNNATTVMIERVISSAGLNNEYLLSAADEVYKKLISDRIYKAVAKGYDLAG